MQMKNYKEKEIYVSDNGNESIKNMDENFNKIHFLNVIAEVTDEEAEDFKRAEKRFGNANKRKNVYDNLDVTVYKDGNKLGRYYIGPLAIEQYFDKANRRDAIIEKYKDNQTYICSYTATALNILSKTPEENHVNAGEIIFGTMVPMKEFLSMSEDDVKEVIDKIKGHIKIEFNFGILEGKTVEYIVEEEDAFVRPEGGIGLEGLFYNEDGTRNEEFISRVGDQYLFGLDIGSIDANSCCIKVKGYVSKFCKPVGEGIKMSFDEIIPKVSSKIKKETGVDVTVTSDELNYVIRKLNYKYPFRGDEIDISKEVNSVLHRRVQETIKEFNNKIPNILNNKTHRFYCFGGGAILMKDFIEPLMAQRFVTAEVTDPVWLNCISAVKVLKNKRLERESSGSVEVAATK